MSGSEPPRTAPPQVRAMVTALDRAGVRYVLTGSVAAAAWTGRKTHFGDLDIAPELHPDNLARLARLLAEVHARPVHRPEWKRTLSPEECERWRPDPATAEQLDHQLETSLGLLDVVPSVSGEFSALIARAHPVHAWGVEILVADPADLMVTLRPDRRSEHRTRLAELEAIRARPGSAPRGIETLDPEEG